MVALPIVQERMADLAAACRAHRAKRLELFGSAATGRLDPLRSDLDFLVEFEPMTPPESFDCFFDLRADLERLFSRDIDLLTPASVANPCFRAAIERVRTALYDA